MNHLEEIRLRIGIEELVGGHVQLKKAGRNLRGLCPFHGEKTPSFMVSPDKGIAYCFGCHQGGDIFKFTQLIEGVDFGEAVRMLAEKANVPLPRQLPELNNKRLKIIEINQRTVDFYQEELEKNSDQKTYFLERGLSEATIRDFQLGFAPDSFDRLKNHLAEKGFEKKDLIEAAVVSQRSIADQNIFDRFRNRLIFPIFDHQDNPVGFSGRIVGEGEPKYLNSPETPAYNKSLILYGLNWAKETIRKEDCAIIMEGYMDVIAAHQAGHRNAVATCGTALTSQQIKLIQRHTKNLLFAFDGDSAGMEATFRAIELAQEADLNLRIILIPEGKDPDECIRKNPGKWDQAVRHPITIMDFYFGYAFRQFDRESMEGKKQIMDFLLPLIKLHKSDVERSVYLNRLAMELKTDVRFLWGDLKKTSHRPRLTSAPSDPPSTKRIFVREDYLIGFMMAYPEWCQEVASSLITDVPMSPKTERFYNAIQNMYNPESSAASGHFRERLEEEFGEEAAVYALLIEEAYPDFSEEAARREVNQLVREINRHHLQSAQKDVEISLRSSEDPVEKKNLLGKYHQLMKLRADA